VPARSPHLSAAIWANVFFWHKRDISRLSSNVRFGGCEKFNHPTVFDKKITTEGQLVAFLTEPRLTLDFAAAFVGGNYSIRFRRTDTNDERIYEIEQSVPASVLAGLNTCINSMMN
jgi:hypothetical protein